MPWTLLLLIHVVWIASDLYALTVALTATPLAWEGYVAGLYLVASAVVAWRWL